MINPDLIILGVTWFIVFLFSTTLHEAAHALAAYRLGDPTAYHGGQVSLNPIPHIQREPWGMVLVPILSFALTQNWMMGWASAPYDPLWAHRHPRRAALMALAGPAANLLLVLLAGIGIRIGVSTGAFEVPESVGFTHLFAAHGGATGFVVPLSILFSLNLLLVLFNLLPLPPLDGSAILPMFMSDGLARSYHNVIGNPSFSFLGLLVAWRLFGYVYGPVYRWAIDLLYRGMLG
ncbi:MAG TPA: site-2 protease family protein [Thermoanaerobaculia bacterium]